MASADWMNRNLNSRIELCFPIYDKLIKKEVMEILQLQLHDNTKARHLDHSHNNLPIHSAGNRKIRAQIEIYKLLKG
jgi:polyphosphate kinase